MKVLPAMLARSLKALAAAALIVGAAPADAATAYWSVFNPEFEATDNAVFVTYATLDDMLTGQNPLSGDLGATGPRDMRANVVGSGSDGRRFWSVFNFEGDDTRDAIYVLYNTFQDMSLDRNRVDTFRPDGGGRASDAVGSGSDGTRYWTLFNNEDDVFDDSVYVLYDSLIDMLTDENRVSEVSPTGTVGPNGDYAANVVGSGSDGQVYWNLFNFEADAVQKSIYVTYDSLDDMFMDVNRVNEVKVEFPGVENRVGSGFGPISSVPLPAGLPLLAAGMAVFGFVGWRRHGR